MVTGTGTLPRGRGCSCLYSLVCREGVMVKLPRLRHIRHVPLSRQESFQEAAQAPSGIQKRQGPGARHIGNRTEAMEVMENKVHTHQSMTMLT